MQKNKHFLFFKIFRRVLHAFIFSFTIFGSSMECISIKTLLPYLEQLQPGDWLVVDIDDTIITPTTMMFRTQSPYHKLIDNLKASPNSDVTVSTWRLSRKIMLVEKEWALILELLKKKGVIVIALTQMHTGSFGKISSMEKWRAEELKALNVNFSPYAPNDVEILIDGEQPATLYQGILFTGSHTKAATLTSFVNKCGKPPKLIFIDDRIEHVKSLEKLCIDINIPFEGYHYQAVTQLPYDANKDFGATQTQKLQNDGVWLEDSQIQAMD